MKIYDCFTFFNELDILDIRLNEMYDVVDYFVIVEANTSFRGNPKPFNLESNWDRYQKFHAKIRYIKVEDIPTTQSSYDYTLYNRYSQENNLSPQSPWTREAYQRDCILRGLYDMTDDSWIIVSDCDEVLRSSTIQKLRDDTKSKIIGCRLSFFYFKLNFMSKNAASWLGPIACRGNDFHSAQYSRQSKNRASIIYDHAGWHWSYLGDESTIKYKIQNFSHAEHDHPHLLNNLNLETMLQTHSNMYGSTDYVSLNITDYWPDYIAQNVNLWQNYISQDTTMLNIFDIYP